MMRQTLIAEAASAMAFTTSSRRTKSATSAWLVGRSTAALLPKTTATTTMAPRLKWPVEARIARVAAPRPRVDWVTRRMRRRG